MNLEERVARLESSARRWRAASIGMAFGGIILILIGAAPPSNQPQELSVKGLTVVNDDGDAVIVLASFNGKGQMHVAEPKARKPGFSASAGGLRVGGQNGSITATASGKGTALVLNNGKGDSAVMIYPDEAGVGHISLLRDGKTVAWEAPASP